MDTEKQTKLIAYYAYGVAGANSFVSKADEFNREYMPGCHEGLESLFEPRSREEGDFWNRQIISTENTAAESIAQHDFDTLKLFHPTKDRLGNPLLRLLMGSETVKFLSGEEELGYQ